MFLPLNLLMIIFKSRFIFPFTANKNRFWEKPVFTFMDFMIEDRLVLRSLLDLDFPEVRLVFLAGLVFLLVFH